LSEPFVFQIMRQLGAVFGWLAFLRRKIDWMPQRPVTLIQVPIPAPTKTPVVTVAAAKSSRW
jgi:hypothetical protein